MMRIMLPDMLSEPRWASRDKGREMRPQPSVVSGRGSVARPLQDTGRRHCCPSCSETPPYQEGREGLVLQGRGWSRSPRKGIQFQVLGIRKTRPCREFEKAK